MPYQEQDRPPTRQIGNGRSPRHRLANLIKLYHVPVFALRELLERHADGASFGNLRQAKLVQKADEMESIGESEIDELHENYRYGRRLSFYLYLLPSGLKPPSLRQLQTVLDEQAVLERRDLLDEIEASEDLEEALPRQVRLLDEEQLESFREIRFRYLVAHRFLNADEQPDEVLQSRYGFLWLDLTLGYLAILSRDERVNNLLTLALSRCLQAVPQPVRFPKELLDKHFSIERAKRLSYYDPSTGVRRSISGQSLWMRFEQEIMTREQQSARPSSLYDEQVADGLVSGLGVTASKGKIYLTRTLPTSVVREWARQRLPELVRDVKDLREGQLDSVKQTLEAISRARLPSPGKTAILAIVEALLQTEREGLSSTSLGLTALDIYQALEGKYFAPYFRTQCSRCDETAELCPYCESRDVTLESQRVTCGDCGATLSDGQSLALRCMNGHVTRVQQSDAWNIAPNHWLQKRMARIFSELGQSWDEQADYFYIEGNTLYRLRRGEVETSCLHPVIKQYINNFLDPVTGLVHTGGGNIYVTQTSPDSVEEPSAAEQPPVRTERCHTVALFRSFDLRIRGSASEGYTVEASAGARRALPPEPLLLPRDQAFQTRLANIFDGALLNGNLQAIGKALFNALFPPSVRRLWREALNGLADGDGLRIALHIDPPELLPLPWELLYEDQYLVLQPGLSVVRYVDVPGLPKPTLFQPPLRVLGVAGGSGKTPAMAAGTGLAGLGPPMSELSDRMRIDLSTAAGSDELLARLRRGYHVLHYAGDATYSQGEGYLSLSETNPRPVHSSGTWLGQAAAQGTLRLVLFQARAGSVEGCSAYHALAQQVVRAGIPAALALPRGLAGPVESEFFRELYAALTEGCSVETAVQQARRSILAIHANGTGPAWAVPALYVRAPDIVIVGAPGKEVEGLMKRREEIKPTVTYTPTFHAPIYGPVLTGRGDIRVTSLQYGIQADELASLFDGLRSSVERQAPPEKREEALKEVGALKKALQEKKPNLGRMEAVLQWFKRYVPQLAGAVASVIVNPIVGKVVEAAGEYVVAEFKQRFGQPQNVS